jgi:hypothetical protein
MGKAQAFLAMGDGVYARSSPPRIYERQQNRCCARAAIIGDFVKTFLLLVTWLMYDLRSVRSFSARQTHLLMTH